MEHFIQNSQTAEELNKFNYAAQLLGKSILNTLYPPKEKSVYTPDEIVTANSFEKEVAAANDYLIQKLPSNTFLKVLIHDKEYGLIHISDGAYINEWQLLPYSYQLGSGQDFANKIIEQKMKMTPFAKFVASFSLIVLFTAIFLIYLDKEGLLSEYIKIIHKFLHQ